MVFLKDYLCIRENPDESNEDEPSDEFTLRVLHLKRGVWKEINIPTGTDKDVAGRFAIEACSAQTQLHQLSV